MFKLIVWGLVIYLIYKFVWELVVPVSKATSQMQEKIKEMQEMQERQARQNNNAAKSQPKEDDSSTAGEYIDYEEIK